MMGFLSRNFCRPSTFWRVFLLNFCYVFANATITILPASSSPLLHLESNNSKIRQFCIGTDNGLSRINTNGENHYVRLKRSFQNCQRIIGNLELTHITAEDVEDEIRTQKNPNNITEYEPFYFLRDLVEISGNLIIFNVGVSEIVFPELRFIWGENLYDGYALTISRLPNMTRLSFPQLRLIANGKIRLSLAPGLCEWSTEMYKQKFNKTFRETSPLMRVPHVGVDYSELLPMGPIGVKQFVNEHLGPDACYISRQCHHTCENSCFSPEPDDCQQIYRRICTLCPNGCYRDPESKKPICCHENCLGGCFGPGSDQCAACQNFEEDGKCVNQCRGMFTYNSKTMEKELLPKWHRRYFYGSHCLKECPPGMLVEDDKYCVARCSAGFYRDIDVDETRCVPCNGPCPKVCQFAGRLDSVTIKQLVNCTEIEGHIELLGHVFDEHVSGSDMTRILALDPAHLNVLRTVRVITGHIAIDGSHKMIPGMWDSLEFLENLEMVEGRKLYHEKFALYIVGHSSLKHVGLRSLRKVKNGMVAFRLNKNLCYSYSIPFKKLIGADFSWKDNMNSFECEKSGRQCDINCDPDSGCWGPGPKMCLKCRNFIRDGTCSAICPKDGYFVSRENSKLCERCHPQCSECFGTQSTECRTCRNFEHWTREIEHDGIVTVLMDKVNNCVPACPNGTYPRGKRCEECHKACYEFGCTGPAANLRQGGCNKCRYAVEKNNSVRCLVGETELTVCHESSSHLALNYVNALGPPDVSLYMCRQCPAECRRCTRESTAAEACECAAYKLFDRRAARCVNECGKGSYILTNLTLSVANETVAGTCQKCHAYCDERFSCSGISSADCERCAVGGIQLNGTTIECVAECPPETPVAYEGMCYDESPKAIALKRRNTTIGIALMSALLFALIISYLGYRCMKYRKKYEKEAQMHLPEIPALDPRKVTQRPNMRRLNLIAIDELDDSKNNVLGQGAFGTVYAGKWKPPNSKNHISIPVAIKVINKNEARHTTEAEMMKEAGIMASIQHEHLLPLVGICVAKDGVKIVTILRPLGSLLKFLKEHKERLGSKSLMLYCYQISSAMEFLARSKIVHRDLATRNVLVKNINHVEVTDFGLARMLQGCDTSVVIDGRVAIKWLAIESLRQQIYTERTDVWSFGVTCWEILTFGNTPYNELRLSRDSRMARDLASHLEKGYRLTQPTNCSQELYQELLNCWLVDFDSRPSFRQLKERFELFCRAPHIYIQERRATQRMDSITSSDQRQMIERLLQDSDFLDPVNIDPADYCHSVENGNIRSSNFFSSDTAETTLPPHSPCTSTRPLMSGDPQASISTTSSSRYRSDPTGRKNRSSADDSAGLTRTSETEMLDDENYLMPRSIGNRSIIGKSIDEMPDEEKRAASHPDDIDYLPTYLNETDIRPESIPESYANSVQKTPEPPSSNLSIAANSITEKESCANASKNSKIAPYMNVQQCESTL